MSQALVADPQDPQAKLDHTVDWSADLSAGVTITSATVICPTPGVTITGPVHDDSTVTFRLGPCALTQSTWIDCIVHIVLSTGEEDERTLRVQITDL
jgi:hypothetical protein